MAWPVLLAAGIGATAALGSTAMDIASNKATNDANKEIARENNRTMVDLANTQYARSKQDMLNSGLNPALMYGSGSPAPTPAMQAPVLRATDHAKLAEAGNMVANAVLQGQSLKQSQQTIDNNYLEQIERIAKIKSEIANMPTNTGKLELEKELAKAQTKLAEFNARPNSIDQLGTKLLSRFLEAMEARYNKRAPTGSGAANFFKEMGFPDFPLR